ncbi:MAG: hypothetical protein RI931_150 [Actinomycetota bacterium]
MATTPRAAGIGRVLIAVYAVFAVSSSARASYQLLREFDQAPVAYLLSALAALVYILATVSLAKKGATWNRIAWLAVSFELVGVIAVGALSLLQPELFGHPSVWSNFGAGYGYIPLILPILGLLWLRKTNSTAEPKNRAI